MRFYGYRLDEVEKMDAKQFFILIEEMYRINANERLEDINTGIVPHLKREDAKRIIKGYENLAIDIRDKLKLDMDHSKIKELKTQL